MTSELRVTRPGWLKPLYCLLQIICHILFQVRFIFFGFPELGVLVVDTLHTRDVNQLHQHRLLDGLASPGGGLLPPFDKPCCEVLQHYNQQPAVYRSGSRHRCLQGSLGFDSRAGHIIRGFANGSPPLDVSVLSWP